MTVQEFGKYKVIKVLGRGGMAEVYLAHDPMLDRDVAIKVIIPRLADEQGFEERFRREAKLVASLRHPNVVQVYEFDLFEGSPYMVMESLTGGTLKDRMKEYEENGSAMPLPEIARILTPIAAGLEYAHQRGLVHRDLKPGNILFTGGGEPVITDFGIAKILGQSTHMSLAVVGTPVYMSPEQASNKPIDARCDIYSLGVMLYEMATGRVPFEGDSTTAIMMQHVMNPPPPLRDFNPAIPESVQSVILKALAKNPEARYTRPTELARAFAAAARGNVAFPVAPEAPTLAESTRSPDAPVAAIVSAPRTDPTPSPGESRRPVSVPPVPEPAPSVTRRRAGNWRLGLVALVVLLLIGGGGGLAWFLSGKGDAAFKSSAATLALRFRDGAAQNDEAILSVSGLADPPAGKQYQVWLLDTENEKRRSLGTLKLNETKGTLAATNPEGHSWLADFNGAEITLEPSPDPSPLASGQVIAFGRIPPDILLHLRHVLVKFDSTPGQIGLGVGLVKEAKALQQTAADTLTAFQAKDMKKVRKNSEGMVNLIEGSAGEHFHDIDGDGTKSTAGDGFGLFPNGKQVGYLEGVQEHIRFATEAKDVSQDLKMHAGHVQVCIQNVSDWTVELRDKALSVAEAKDPSSMEATIRDMVSLTSRILKGQDVNGNEEIEPIRNEGGVLTAYQHAQFMAGISLDENGSNVPLVRNEPGGIPTMDMSSMVMPSQPPSGAPSVQAPTAAMDMMNMGAPSATPMAAAPAASPTPAPAQVTRPAPPPAATLTPSGAPAPTLAAGKGTVLFEDNFDGAQLDNTKWVLDGGAGANVTVASGLLRMSSTGSAFPYVHSRSAVFPETGDLQMTLRYRYSSVGGCGATLAAGSFFQFPYRPGEQPRVEPATDPSPLMINLWPEVVWYDEPGAKRRIPLPGEFTAMRNVVIEYAGGRYRLWMDGQLLVTSDPTKGRLRYIYFGNPAIQTGSCAWDTIEIDSVQVIKF